MRASPLISLRRYGRSPRGDATPDHTPVQSLADPHASSPRSELGGLRAPAVFNGPLDNPSFLAYVEQVLIPTLAPRATSSSSTISPFTNNPPSAAAIEAVGAQLRFLPPYSPDFNPIEYAFAKLKAFLRAARPRTFDQVLTLVHTALPFFAPAECRNYISHCGYRFALPL